MTPKISQGFSLLEIMIVVTIMGIITSISLPAYRDYVKRARFAEVVAAAEPYKIALAVALQSGANASELTNGKFGIPAAPNSTKNLASIEVKNSKIIATGTHLVDDKTYILEADANGSEWKISGTCLDSGFCNA